MERGWPSQLAAGLEQMGLPLEPERQRRLIDYLALLYKWNRAYNLTAVRDPRQAV
ncbi:MAG TPA: 16S rRNA (guanine(527)-N(7))-methyltransferase RsmG, partial [Thiolapillus brandeum]|nr:16S rRNA (guanine(527)-N(7))-methyltransferase RsmG [Thiolapillus brandeum]